MPLGLETSHFNMSDTLEIIVSGSLPSPQIELSPAAFNARTLALEASGRIKAIASVADLDAAASALTKLKALTRSVEDSRKEVKAPVLEVGRRIDAVAKDYLTSLESEATRLSVIVGSYQEAQRRKAEKERQAAANAQAGLASGQAAEFRASLEGLVVNKALLDRGQEIDALREAKGAVDKALED